MRQLMVFRLVAVLVLAGGLLSVRAQYSAVRINEILANNTLIPNLDGRITDLVELHNTGGTDVDLSGCYLSDSNSHPTRFVFPFSPYSIVPAFGFMVLQFDSVYTNFAPNTVPFGIKASGGNLYLRDPFLTLIDSVDYGLQLQDHSIVRMDPTTWTLGTPSLGAPNTSLPLGDPSALRFNEWLADQSSGDDYFELYNTAGLPVAMGGMILTDTPAQPLLNWYVAPLSFIGTGQLAYARFIADGGGTNRFPADHVSFKLSAGGDQIFLFQANSVEVHRVVFGAQTKDVSEGFLPDGNTNGGFVRFPKLNDYETRSPGEPNFLILTNLAVNEILTHTDPPREDAVEFINRAATNINISGWWLSNNRFAPKKYLLPAGAALTPNGFRVIYEGTGIGIGFNSPAAVEPFTFNSAHGDDVVLSQTDANGNLTGYMVYEKFEGAANGISFGYYKTSVANDYKFVAMATTTFGADDANTLADFRAGTGLTNSYPRIGPIVINEVLFAPNNSIYYLDSNGMVFYASGPGLLPVFSQNPDEEFIELRNVTSLDVPLYDPAYPTNHWRLQKALNFVFPLTNLPPNSICLVVGFNPHTNPVALANFRSKYSVSNDVPIFGPWTGRLADGGDSIELYRPDAVQLPPRPDAGFVPSIRVDKVNYNSAPPWPGGANGTGKSLQRKNSLFFGNDPINWAVDNPTAGTPTSSALQDSDGDGIPNSWETQYGFNPNSAADGGSDPDNDGVGNLGEYVSGTNPTNATSVLRVLDIIPSPDNYQPAYIRFLAYSNATYTVETRNSLNPSANWKKVADVPALPYDRIESVADQGVTNKTDRYYRVVAPATN